MSFPLVVELSVILPVHNEHQAIGKLLDDLLPSLKTTGRTWEVIIVNDGSNDATARVLEHYKDSIRILTHDSRLGTGASLKTGSSHARGNLVAWMDGDGTYSSSDLLRLLQKNEEADQIIGARSIDHGFCPKGRWFLKKITASTAGLLWDKPIPDLNSGLRLFHKAALETILPFIPQGFSNTTTATLAGLNAGQDIGFVPIGYHARTPGSKSKFRVFQDSFLLLKTMLRFWLLKPGTDFTSWTLRLAALSLAGLFLQTALALLGGMSVFLSGWIILSFLGTLVCLTLTAVSSGVEKPSGGFQRISWMTLLGIVFLTGLFLLNRGQPNERILGGNDEGIYANTAIQLAREKGYPFTSAWVRHVFDHDDLRSRLLVRAPAMALRGESYPQKYWQLHPGFYTAQTGGITAQFPLGFTVFQAAWYQVAGFTALCWANTFCLAGSALLIGLLSSRWLGKRFFLLGFALFLFFPLHVWISRTLFAEPLVQFLWILGLFALGSAPARPRISGIAAALALSFAFLVKIDAWPVLLMIPVLSFLNTGTTQKFRKYFSVTGMASLAFVISVCLSFQWPYLKDSLNSTWKALGAWLPVLILTGVLGMTLSGSFKGISRTPALQRLASILPWMIALFVFGAAGYAYFIRPFEEPFARFYYWPFGAEIRSYQEATLLRLAWYLSPLGLAAAILGTVFLLFRIRTSWQGLMLLVGGTLWVLLCYDIRNNPIQPYCMRRFIPFASPLIILGLAAFFAVLGRKFSHSKYLARAPQFMACLFLGGLLLFFSRTNRKMNHLSEYAGLHSGLGEVALKIPPNSIVLIPGDSANNVWASPLQFIYEKPVFLTEKLQGSGKQLQAEFAWIREQQHRVLLLLPFEPSPWWKNNFKLKFLDRGDLQTLALVQNATDQPGAVQMLRWRYQIYEILP